jgi:hypothetical protein
MVIWETKSTKREGKRLFEEFGRVWMPLSPPLLGELFVFDEGLTDMGDSESKGVAMDLELEVVAVFVGTMDNSGVVK